MALQFKCFLAVAPAESSNVSAFDVTKENKSVFVVRPTCKLNYGIYQPSTSKAVWNNSSGVYEEGKLTNSRKFVQYYLFIRLHTSSR